MPQEDPETNGPQRIVYDEAFPVIPVNYTPGPNLLESTIKDSLKQLEHNQVFNLGRALLGSYVMSQASATQKEEQNPQLGEGYRPTSEFDASRYTPGLSLRSLQGSFNIGPLEGRFSFDVGARNIFDLEPIGVFQVRIPLQRNSGGRGDD